MNTAVVIGVGPLRGLGAYLCLGAAREALHVVVAGRSEDKVDAVVATIEAGGGVATAIVCDTTQEQQVVSLMEQAEAIAFLKQHNCDGVLAFGGGSSIDSAKVIAMAGANGFTAARSTTTQRSSSVVGSG